MSSVTAMTKHMEQRTREEEQVWPVPIDVCPVLSEEEEADDGEETEKGDSEAAHRESEKGVIPDDHHGSFHVMSASRAHQLGA